MRLVAVSYASRVGRQTYRYIGLSTGGASSRHSLLAGRCISCVEQCKDASATLRCCVHAATSHTARCCALLRAAGAAVAALDEALSAPGMREEQLRQLQATCAAVLAGIDMAIMRVKARHCRTADRV